MDPVDVHFIPPPAYSEEEFDQKTSRATDLSWELAKWEIDEDGFPRYDPAMFDDPPRAQKGKEQPSTFRSSSISKRPLPNPTDAGPSTLRQTQPLHISKKSISKAEEAATRAEDIPVSDPSTKYIPEDIPPYAYLGQSVEGPPEHNPPYTPTDPHVSNSPSIEDIPGDNPPYEPNYSSDPVYDEQTEHWEEGTTSWQEISQDEPFDRPESAQLGAPEHLGQGREILTNTTTVANQALNRQSQYSTAPDPSFHNGPHLSSPNSAMSNHMPDTYSMATAAVNQQSRYSMAPNHRGPQLLNPNTASVSNHMLDEESQSSMTPNHRGPNTTMPHSMLDEQPQYSMAPNHRGPPLSNPNSVTMSNHMLDAQSQYSLAPNHRGPPFLNHTAMSNNMPDEQSQYSVAPNHRGPQSLNPNTATMSNYMIDAQSMAPNPPVHRGPQQHFSLPPAPRSPPRIHPSDRPRSQSTIPTSPSTLSRPAAPRVLFNLNMAYGKNSMGSQVPQFRPKSQTPQAPFQAHYDPTTFYNAAVSSHLSTSMKIPDQSPPVSNPVQRPQVRPIQTYSTPANPAVNQSRQWGWHPPGRPSNTYRPVTDTSYGRGGTDVSRHSHYSVTDNGYFSQ